MRATQVGAEGKTVSHPDPLLMRILFGAMFLAVGAWALWKGFGPSRRLPGHFPYSGATREANPIRFWCEAFWWLALGVGGGIYTLFFWAGTISN
jgi:uncharacterized membrane protein YfcA